MQISKIKKRKKIKNEKAHKYLGYLLSISVVRLDPDGRIRPVVDLVQFQTPFCPDFRPLNLLYFIPFLSCCKTMCQSLPTDASGIPGNGKQYLVAVLGPARLIIRLIQLA